MVKTEDLIRAVETMGNSIIEHAAEIVGDYQYQAVTEIKATIGMDNKFPEVTVTTSWISEEAVQKIVV